MYDHLHLLWRPIGNVDTMREQLADGALLILVGMAVVMTALIILMLAVMVMTRLFPGKDISGDRELSKATEASQPTKQTVAAIAVAVALAMKEQEAGNTSGHDDSSISGPVASRWSAAGRERLMASRGKKEPKRWKPSR